MSARRLLTIARALLAETKTPDEIEAMLTPLDPETAELEAKYKEWKAAQ